MSTYVNEPGEQPIELELCVIKSTGKYGYQALATAEELSYQKDMTRVSEFVKLTFKPRLEAEIIPEMIAKIDAEIQSQYIDVEERVSRLKARKSELLAITNQSNAVEINNCVDIDDLVL
jgi:FMN phosphatase YigB (HAD superfamily)